VVEVFFSVILNPFLRVFAISAPKPQISGTLEIIFPHILFQILAIRTFQKVKTPMSRLSCPNNENPVKFFSKNFEKKKIEKKF